MVLARIKRPSGKKIENRGLLAHTDLILAGDLNFTLNSDEIWGTTTLSDPLEVFFKDLFYNSPLVDVALTELVLTWCNGRMGVSSISKTLDNFFVVEDFIGSTMRYCSWVDSTFISNHAPIILQMDIGVQSIKYPFKFNPGWLKEESLAELTREVWMDNRFDLIVEAQIRLVKNMSLL
jgi:hypothetical protein